MYKLLECSLGTVLMLMCVFAGKEIEMREQDNCSVLSGRLQDLEEVLYSKLRSLEEKQRNEYTNAINRLKQEHRIKIDNLKQELNRLREEKTALYHSEKQIEVLTRHRKSGITRNQRYLLDSMENPIGFTAYVDHSVQHLGINQSIIFNQVLFNDGGAYNTGSGIFACPVNGVYLFFFEVGSGTQRQIAAKLVVNGVNNVDAIADAEYHEYHEAQGSNMAILRLRQGDHVWVENYRWADQSVEGAKKKRFTTFSGILLYTS